MTRETVLIQENILAEKNDEVILLGSRCGKCKQIYFPPKSFCVECLETEMIQHELGNRGVLYSFSTSYMPSAHFSAPYTAGWIEMQGQIRVFAPIFTNEGQKLQLGMPMQLFVDALWEKGEKLFIGYYFKPMSQEGGLR